MKPLPDQSESAKTEAEAGSACALVGEIVAARANGNRDSTLGNSDDDLLYALEEARDAIASLLRVAFDEGER